VSNSGAGGAGFLPFLQCAARGSSWSACPNVASRFWIRPLSRPRSASKGRRVARSGITSDRAPLERAHREGVSRGECRTRRRVQRQDPRLAEFRLAAGQALRAEVRDPERDSSDTRLPVVAMMPYRVLWILPRKCPCGQSCPRRRRFSGSHPPWRCEGTAARRSTRTGPLAATRGEGLPPAGFPRIEPRHAGACGRRHPCSDHPTRRCCKSAVAWRGGGAGRARRLTLLRCAGGGFDLRTHTDHFTVLNLHQESVGRDRDLLGALACPAKGGECESQVRRVGMLDGLRVHRLSPQSSRTGSPESRLDVVRKRQNTSKLLRESTCN